MSVNKASTLLQEQVSHPWSSIIVLRIQYLQDPKATQTLPLPGHNIKVVSEAGDRPNVFALMHKDITVCHFQTDTEEDLQQ